MHGAFSRIKEVSTTTGTGNLTLAGALNASWLEFADKFANGDSFYVVIEHQSAAEVEVCLATFVSATPAIARGTGEDIIMSSNAGAAVNFSAGDKHIYIAPVAESMAYGPAMKVYLSERFM